jgi:predicted HTH transcriptional regulator
LPGKDSEAIDFRTASEDFLFFPKLRKSDLRTLLITSIYQNREVLTVGGFLLFGRDRRAVFPDAYDRGGASRALVRTMNKNHGRVGKRLLQAV